MRQWLLASYFLLATNLLLSSSSVFALDTAASLKTHPSPISPTIIATVPYNNNWFTQGLYQDDDNNFYISSGLYGRSTLIFQQPHKITRYSLPPKFFAEGLTVVGDKIFLLTWQEQTLLVFDKKTLKPINKVSYTGEGWGLTHNEKSLIMSNGSDTLYFRDKDSFKVQHTMTVKGLDKINELEYIDGVIWANRWLDDNIYAIDAETGCILQSIDVSSLRSKSVKPDDKNVVNGIAYDKNKNGLWVTGKLWNHRFLIALPSLDKTQCHTD